MNVHAPLALNDDVICLAAIINELAGKHADIVKPQVLSFSDQQTWELPPVLPVAQHPYRQAGGSNCRGRNAVEVGLEIRQGLQLFVKMTEQFQRVCDQSARV